MTANRAVVPIHAGQQIAEPKPKISKAVAMGLTDLTIAFRPGRQQSDEDRTRWLQICAKVLAPFHQQLIAEVLDWLLTHNEANPFCPTPQEIHAACKKREGQWRSDTLEKFGLLLNPPRYSSHVPRDLEIEFVRQQLAQWVPDLLAGRPFFRSWGERCLKEMPDTKFQALPREAFPEGTYDQVANMRRHLLSPNGPVFSASHPASKLQVHQR